MCQLGLAPYFVMIGVSLCVLVKNTMETTLHPLAVPGVYDEVVSSLALAGLTESAVSAGSHHGPVL